MFRLQNNNNSQVNLQFKDDLHKQKKRDLTLCGPDGRLIKYPEFPNILHTSNVQPIFLPTI